MGQNGIRMSEFSIRLELPIRRSSTHLTVVVEDVDGNQIFRDSAKLNEEKARNRIAARIAQETGDNLEDINRRLLQAMAQIPPPVDRGGNLGGQEAEYPYEATPGGLIWNKGSYEGIVPVPLTTFTVLITGQVVEDDGVETRRFFEIEAILRNRTYRFQVPSGQFASMNWHLDHMGAGAALYAGLGIKDHARTAIQFLSGDLSERRVYAHLGWREIGETWCYLHAEGAIGPVLDIEVSLPSDLERFALPVPPAGTDLVDAISASLRVPDVTNDLAGFSTYCAVWRAPLGDCDSALHFFGRTGGGKSEAAALAQQHYGQGMDSRHLPGSWSSTDNALEMLAFTAKDALVVVDDFCPSGSVYEAQSMHRKADRLFRAQGNVSGRQRLRPDGTLRPVKPPRGTILSTGEDVPRGQSLRSRLLVSEVPKDGPGSIDWDALTLCQRDAADGLYAQAMAGYIRWLAPRYKDIQTNLKAEISELRAQAHQDGQHCRTPDIVANLAVGFRYFLAFAVEVEALTESQSDDLWRRCWNALGEAAAAQGEHQTDSEPVGRFLELISVALSSGRAHLAGPDGNMPADPVAWGWRRFTGNFGMSDFLPQGERIGWLKDGEIYLLSDSSYAVAQKLARDEGDNISVTLATLKRRLHEQGVLASVEEYGKTLRLEVRLILEGRRRKVLHIKPDSLSTEVGQVCQLRHDDDFGNPSDSDQADVGSMAGTQTEAIDPEVRQQSAPQHSSHVSEEPHFRAIGALGTQNGGEGFEEIIDEVLE